MRETMTMQRDTKRNNSALKSEKGTSSTKKGKGKMGAGNLQTRVKEKANHRKPALGVREKSVAPQLEAQHRTRVKRVSFIVRVLIDENNQSGLTEIELISSNKKQKFPQLNGENLEAFMKTCIRNISVSENTASDVPIPRKVKDLAPEQPKGRLTLQIPNIQLFNSSGLNGMSFKAGEPFIVQARFQLHGTEVQTLTDQEADYEINIYTNEITSGISKLLLSYRSRLIQNIWEYSIPLKLSGLSHGLYRLSILVTLGTDSKVAGHHDGPTIQVV